ncbi:McrB [Stenotrophomonas ginsengisoli]|uniref:McrB n=1 Tax=Stenotrophomonas ginsengisoli TaxID=336566 RepID=A0A0R0D8I8_9GAMM|nr:AAA family ATPase [Stenotrophomonas ginsengisoli]KRG74270.1 McrB [Stenotrophomonas ginsengisoli]
MAFDLNESLWDEFLVQWPISRLRMMTLDEYTRAGDKDCFTYWMEGRLDGYGSIWGGSAFKFGIYSRNDSTPKVGDGSRAYDEHYGWYQQFGSTPERAFDAVRSEVLAIAEAASRGELDVVDRSRLGESYRWKIAFHYQQRDGAPFPCVFSRKPLLHAMGLPATDRRTPLSQLYGGIAAMRQEDEPLMAFSRKVWRDWVEANPLRITLTQGAIDNGYLSFSLISAPFPETVRGGATDAEAGEPLEFLTDTGERFKSDFRTTTGESGRLRKRLGSYFRQKGVRAGDAIVIAEDEDGVYRIRHESKSRIAESTSPAVTQISDGASDAEVNMEDKCLQPINRIYYGPPGTGKTHGTVDAALELLDPSFLAVNAKNRDALKQRFDELAESGHIHFVTFHQSFSYEDFVEGIRANAAEEGGGLEYSVEPGVFKTVCEAARSRVVTEGSEGLDVSDRRIWKLSLGDALTEGHIFEQCMANGCALLGFGSGVDLTGVASRQDITDRLKAAGQQGSGYPATALNVFVRQMKPGDLILVTEGNLKFRAIGEITGDYQFVDSEDREYTHSRPVRWLRQYSPGRPYQELTDKRFSQMTVYEPSAIKRDRLVALLDSGQAEVNGPEARVLIIDEINRGNVSRIFGELITLIEPSKRDGQKEALSVTLPYSKERFSVPSNLHLIGTMNNADRSLASLDVALRRRFEFIELPPRPELLAGVLIEDIDVAQMLTVMNQRIAVLLGRDYQIGHAWFMGLKDAPSMAALAKVFRRQVIPLLQEYFYEDWQKIAWVLNDHRKASAPRFLIEPGMGSSALFGEGIDLPGLSRLWQLDDEAFDDPAAYMGIYQDASVAQA